MTIGPSEPPGQGPRWEVVDAAGTVLHRQNEHRSALCRTHEVPPAPLPDGGFGAFSHVAAPATPKDPFIAHLSVPLAGGARRIVWHDAPCGAAATPLAELILR